MDKISEELCVAGFVAALILSCCSSEAQTIGVSTYTHHFGGNFEDTTPGVYLRHGNWTVGTVQNSIRRQSFYGGYVWETGDRRFSLIVGAITGYRIAPVLPLVAPSYRQPIMKDVAARFTLLPGIKAPPAIHFSLEHEF